MASKRHTGRENTAMPRSGRQPGSYPNDHGRSKTPAGRSASPVQPSGEVSAQRGGSGGRSPFGKTLAERGVNPLPARSHALRRGENLPNVNIADTAMPVVGHQSATAPGALGRPASERGSATMDARSSVPTSIQEACHAGDTRERFGTPDAYEKNARGDNAELDDGVGTGRRSRGTFRGSRRY